MNGWWDELYAGGQRWSTKPHALATSLGHHLKTGAKVVDLGCGDGRDCRYLRSAGMEVVGIDCSSAAISAARAAGDAGISYQVRDALAFLEGLPTGSLDGVLSVNALSHLGGKLEVGIRGLRRVLKSGAAVALSLFSESDEEWLHHEPVAPLCYSGSFGQVRLCTRRELEEWLAGYSNVEIDKHEFQDAPHAGAQFPHLNSFWRVLALA